MYLHFALTAIAPPAIGWFLNLLVRRREVLRSSGADWILLVIVFDFAAIADLETFTKYIADDSWRHEASGCFAIVAFLCTAVWFFVVSFVEPKIRPKGVAVEAGQEDDARKARTKAAGKSWTTFLSTTNWEQQREAAMRRIVSAILFGLGWTCAMAAGALNVMLFVYKTK